MASAFSGVLVNVGRKLGLYQATADLGTPPRQRLPRPQAFASEANLRATPAMVLAFERTLIEGGLVERAGFEPA
ncbi:hypothetical protein [Hyphomicrobium sp.]|uniref:hypothetical protein n=1 Tax=Hyphomicrobium sp. TaxID=82 RepID=UPI001D872F93|nr:hypothetical protein [Hyphomicrobium sp.]MBY0560435.1 hypothetical protein [Hyphomicrobium sp.]